jgi:hypothetical protein
VQIYAKRVVGTYDLKEKEEADDSNEDKDSS